MPDETTQPTPEPTTTEAFVQQTDSVPVDMLPVATEAPTSLEDPISLKDVNPANEPLEQPAQPSPEATADETEPEKTAQNNEIPVTEPEKTTEPISPQIPSEPKISEPEQSTQTTTNPNITIEKRGTDVTITEVMKPKESESEIPPPSREATVGQSKSPNPKTFLKSLLPKLKEKLSFRTEKRLSKIMELARKNGEIKNDDVEKLLHVSDASATNYLSKLVKRGSLRISGPKNHAKYLPN